MWQRLHRRMGGTEYPRDSNKTEKDLVAGIRMLLGYGANVDMKDALLDTPLNRISNRGNELRGIGFSVFKALLDAGSLVDAKNKYGYTALHNVMIGTRTDERGAAGPLPAAKQLLLAGADPDATNDKGETPLEVLAGRKTRWEDEEKFEKAVEDLKKEIDACKQAETCPPKNQKPRSYTSSPLPEMRHVFAGCIAHELQPTQPCDREGLPGKPSAGVHFGKCTPSLSGPVAFRAKQCYESCAYTDPTDGYLKSEKDVPVAFVVHETSCICSMRIPEVIYPANDAIDCSGNMRMDALYSITKSTKLSSEFTSRYPSDPQPVEAAPEDAATGSHVSALLPFAILATFLA